ncbi:MAG: hypothetical protein ACOYK9_03390 [Chlamydiia bacterium]
MVAQPPFIVLVLADRLSRYQALWISAFFGFIHDLLTLSLPLGFFTLLYAILSLLWSFSKPFIPQLGSLNSLPFVFLFSFVFVFLECSLLSTFHHPLEDLILGPLFDTALFGVIVLLGKWFIKWKTWRQVGAQNETD